MFRLNHTGAAYFRKLSAHEPPLAAAATLGLDHDACVAFLDQLETYGICID